MKPAPEAFNLDRLHVNITPWFGNPKRGAERDKGRTFGEKRVELINNVKENKE